MHKKILFLFLFFFFFLSLVSAVPPFITETSSSGGLSIEPVLTNYIRTNTDHEFEIHVFNGTTGMPVITGISCYMHLYGEDGNHQLEMEDATASHTFDYAFDVNGTNFTRGVYQAKFQCNNSAEGGGYEFAFYVNDYGLELKDPENNLFTGGIILLLIFFVGSMICIYKFEHYIAKFIFYWVGHLLIVLISFSAWQFTEGYTIGFIGLAGIFKILFYFFTIAVFPMIIVSLAWIFYIHTFNEHFQKLVDKGEDPETAFAMTKKKRRRW